MNRQRVFQPLLLGLLVSFGPVVAGDATTSERDPEEGGGVSPVVVHLEMGETLFKSTIDDERNNNGNQLVDLEVVTTAGPVTLFSGVFYPVTGTIHELIHGDATEWQDFLDLVGPMNGRWLDIEVGYHLSNTRSYSALFLEDGDDYSYLVDSYMTDDQMQTTVSGGVPVPGIMEQQLRAGRSMVDFEAYTDPNSGDTVFAGIWSGDPNQPMTHLYYDLELADLDEIWTPLAGRIVDFERYYSAFFGEERFALLVANVPGGEYYVDTWMTETELGTTNTAESDQDTHLIDLHVFPNPGGPGVLFSGVWGDTWKALEELPALPTVNTVPLTPQLNAQIANWGNSPNGEGVIGFYAKNLRTQQAVSYNGDEPFYLGSATKTAAHFRYWMHIESGHFSSGDPLAFSTGANSGAPWYVDERCPGADATNLIGFGTGQPGTCNQTMSNPTGINPNDLGQSFPLDRFDLAMMTQSDNAATSALIDDPTYGLALDATNLNEWLSAVPGVGQGWGIVTSIHDVDRLIFWNGQHTTAKKNDPSFMRAPGHTFGGYRNNYRACGLPGNPPANCVSQTCQRCFTPATCTDGTQSCVVPCPGSQTCQVVTDPWGDMLTYLGTSSLLFPDWTVGHGRYYAMGTNSATPRAYSNLLEDFWKLDFHTQPFRDAAVQNMGFGGPLDNNFPCREDINGGGICTAGEGFTMLAAKGGAKGGASDSTQVCVNTALIQLNNDVTTDPVNFPVWDDDDEMVSVVVMTRESGDSCGNIRTNWFGLFGNEMVRAVTTDLQRGPGSFGPTTVIEEGQIQIDLHIMNIGGAVSGSFEVQIYASTDLSFDGADKLVTTAFVPSVAGNSTYASGPMNVVLPSSVTAGTYYLLARIDWNDQIDEYDERPSSNIDVVSADQLTVMPPCPDSDGDGVAVCDASCIPYPQQPCGDCDPADATIYPGAVEICDGIDQDCDTIIDNNIPTPLVANRIEYDDPLPYHNFGQAMANLGDLDGDTIDDFVVGIPGGDVAGVLDAGIARVISGADLTTICDAVLASPSTSDSLGESVAAAGGDLNGNGQNDFVVGVPFYDGIANGAGAVAAFNGPDCAFIRLMEDPAGVASDRLGHAVISIGDVDNDTVPDIASSAFLSDLGGTNRGAVHLFSGATGNLLFTMFDTLGVADDLGASLAGPGDLTGDGIPDIAAGAPQTDTSGSANGAVYIFSGADGSYQYRLTDPTGESGADLGMTLVSLGDLGADGVSELAAGQWGDIVNNDRTGSVAIFNSFTDTVLLRLVNPIGLGGSSERFPTALAPIADINGDGITDVLVGADGDDDLASDAGSVFIFDSVTGALLHHVFDPAGVATDQLGTDVISLGDISGDGVPDFAASGPMADNIEGNEAGHVVVFVLEEDCDNDGYSPYAGDCDDMDPAIRPGAFESCDTIDNDCDGLTDEDSDGDGFDTCSDCRDNDPRVNPNGTEICNGVDDDCDGFTDAQPSLPDLDGDGVWGPCSDCDNTNPNINANQPDTCNHIDDDCSGIPDDGFPMVVSTRFSMLPSGEDDDELATDVASIDDVNNDGVDDFVASSPLMDSSGLNHGAAAVFDGATGALICVAAPGTQISEQAGTSVAGVGDVNGDGAGDFAMGAPFHDINTNDEGKIYVLNGDDCTLIRELTDSNGQADDRLGESVAGIGDLTGDGIGEIAGGAPRALTPYGNDAGAVLVWNGATGAELFKLIDTHTGSNRAGTSVAGVDDVNADGVPDIVAGAPFDDGVRGGDVGSVLVFSGADGSIIHKMFDPDGTSSDQVGTAVAGIADLTGDHVPDILAGAPREDSGGSDNGAILVFSGADGTVAQIVPLTDAATSHQFGVSVTALHDLNGDLIPEFAGGSVNDDTEGSNTGRVLIINGADYSVLHDLTVPGSSDDSNLGFALDGIGDLNGDGTPEVIVAQPRQHTQEDQDVGRVVVFSFESDCDDDGVGPFEKDCDDQSGLRYPGLVEFCDGIDNDCDLSIDEDEDGDGDDACVDCDPDNPSISTSMPEVCNMVDDDCDLQTDEGVDLDGDTYTTPCDCDDTDVNVNASIVEACNTIDDNCDGGIDEGFARPLDQVRILDPEPFVADDVGASIALIGDVDSDAFADVVIGVPGDNVVANGAGSAILVSGATREVVCRLLDPAGLTSDAMGRSAAGVGDVTGDGTPDIALGARSDDGAGQASGSVQIFDGATCAWVRELLDPAGAANDFFGTSIASIGDVTGDTVPDIAVGANWDDENGYTNVGSVSVFDGATGAFLYKTLDPHGRSNDQMGISVSALGDVDFDGIPDFAAGAVFDNVLGSTPGSVSLFSGFDGSWIRTMTDPVGANGYIGRSVAAAGDMNGDGVPDLITGAEGDDTGSTNAGAVLAFSGLDGSLIRRFVDSSPLQSADLGAAVAAAGDLDGDGITEVVAGGPDSTRTGGSAGEIVLFDGATGAVLHRFTDASSQSGDDFGATVLAADINGGGIEILAGAPNGDPGGLSSAGYVTVFTLDADCDGDGYSPLADCDDTNGGTTGAPGPAQALSFSDDTTLSWTAPADPGLSPGTLVYDVVRSDDPSDFVTGMTCVESDDGGDTTAADTDTPTSGSFYAYLVRAKTFCGAAADAGRAIATCP